VHEARPKRPCALASLGVRSSLALAGGNKPHPVEQGIKRMDSPLESLEELLNMIFSETFHKFWKAYIPDKISNFIVKRSKLGGAWGQRDYNLQSKQTIIGIEENLAPFHKEMSLAHEILDLVLEREGYPVIYSDAQQLKQNLPGRDPIASNLHSVIIHPVIWFQMREWGFPVDEHIRVKATGQLKDLQSKIDKYPSRSNFSVWCGWLLQYILARLEWGEPERQEIYEIFENRHIPIGRQGEKYIKRLEKLGYFDPRNLTPSIVAKAGDMFLQFLELKPYFTLVSTKPDILR
jgi:hypothetical protein